MITLKSDSSYEEMIKKSRFIAWAGSVDSEQEAADFINKYHSSDATHNSFAFKIELSVRYHDDGEVSGTAGKPILSVIERQGLDHVIVLVTRYFGGIKLGASGLIRAYGGAAAKCLVSAEKEERKPKIKIVIRIPFNLSAIAFPLMESFHYHHRDDVYRDDGIVFTLITDADLKDQIESSVMESTNGRCEIKSWNLEGIS